MHSKYALGRLRWLVERLNPLKRHDFGFLRWMLTNRSTWRAQDTCLLVEEIQRFTLPLFTLASRLSGTRMFVHLHNVRRHDYNGTLFDRIDEALTSWALRRSAVTLVHGERSRDIARTRFRLMSVSIVPHGISTRTLDCTPPSARDRILFFGVNRPNKGLAVLVQALSLLDRPIPLLVAGWTERRHVVDTQHLLAALADAEWQNAYLSEEETAKAFSRATLVVLPYLHFEAQSGVLHLAIEYGVPVVASDVGDMPALIRSYGMGLVVPPNDPSALANAILEASKPEINSELRRAIVTAQTALSWEQSASQLSREIGWLK
jgi:glycosyltransferase involved in cell wall biosynthesis